MIPQDQLMQELGMGTPYVPFTFPTVTVRNNMATANAPATNAEVDRLWSSYYQATAKDGLAPFGIGAGTGAATAALLSYMEAATTIPRGKVAAFLNATYKAVNEQGAARKYLDPLGYQKSIEGEYSLNPIESLKTAAGDVGKAAGNLLKPVADPVTNLVKYAAIALVAGAVIYGVYHGAKIIKAGKRRR